MAENAFAPHDDYRIALYYSYLSIENVNDCIALQQTLCQELHLFGRIRVSPEGMNGVLSGKYQHLVEYETRTSKQLDLSQKLDVKYCRLRSDLPVESQLFPSLSVKATREVVALYDPPPQREEIKEKSEIGKRKKHKQCQDDDMPQSTEKNHDTIIGDTQSNKLSSLTLSPKDDEILQHCAPAPHLSPQEWNAMLLKSSCENAILLDARNVYESRVGHFCVEGVPTLLTNTRKYSYLPQVLLESRDLLYDKRVFMYCTGGVRCERASVYLQAMMRNGPSIEIYQLQGGIQQYLEEFGSMNDENKEECLYQGKNFVFDLRRTDPCVGVSKTGKCVLCQAPHDDYDNGHAPSERKEARCCKCRVLVLVCNDCRKNVRTWGEQEGRGLPDLCCGGLSRCIDDGNCIQSSIV